MERRYSSVLSAISVFVLLTLSVIGCGGGGDDSKSTTPASSQPATTTTPPIEAANLHSTGEEYFVPTLDPYADLRLDNAGDQNIPARMDYSAQMPQIGDQGGTGSCTSWANGYYLKSYQEAKEEGWDKNQNLFSPMYLYVMQCQYAAQAGNPNLSQSSPTSHKILKEKGCAKFSTVPYKDFNGRKDDYAKFQLSQSAHDEAFRYRIGDTKELRNLGEIKDELMTTPVVLSIHWYSKDNLGEWNPSPENNYLKFDSSHDGGHAILCVGYDDTKFGVGALKFINSWGPTWAENGYSWIKYSDVDIKNGNRIVRAAWRVDDSPNPKSAQNKKPDTPTGLQASDDRPYVDIRWNKVQAALSYKVFRREVNNPQNGGVIVQTQVINFRDESANPGVDYFYYVNAVNDAGESDYSGEAIGKSSKKSAKELLKPALKWTGNDNLKSNFEISNIDPSATSMQVFVTIGSTGQWDSLGSFKIMKSFPIPWDEKSKYIGQQPWVAIMVSDGINYSVSSDAVQVETPVPSNLTVAKITTFNAVPGSDRINLSWTTDAGRVDSFEIWRYKYTGSSSEWISLGTGMGDSYYDSDALPGILYYYAIQAQYQGIRGEIKVLTNWVYIVAGANFYLASINYLPGQMVKNSVGLELQVFNTGSKEIPDYEFSVWVYDWKTGQYDEILKPYLASKLEISNPLPLKPGDSQTLIFSLDIAKYANGDPYSWGIYIDPNNKLPEAFENDNSIWGDSVWWANPGTLSAVTREKKSGSGDTDEPLIRGRIIPGPVQFKKPEPAMKY